ncbi:MAG: FAD-dependent oxidoreductase [Lentisphaeria bacterium]|nr:FAD-dependent oxidoreductase [Lentisphaeria bacterium]
MIEKNFDVVIIGAGAAGLAAAAVTARAGRTTAIIDRERYPGGILRQCIHNGFGVHLFNAELTGPEYAERMSRQCTAAGAKMYMNCTVTELKRREDGILEILILSGKYGVMRFTAKAILLAMGCRERNRGNLAIPGSRPAGIYTAGAAQKLLNMTGMLPGKSAVIVGSGDIGLIMARRLKWCGIEVKAVIEIMPHPSGLTRNVVQCLNDFKIPLYLEHSVVNICGRDRVSGVDAAPLNHGMPVMEKAFHIDCDTVLFSVGLIPENELSVNAGIILDPATGGAAVDSSCGTNIPGIFAAGNVLHVHDLADFVSEEASRAGEMILKYLDGQLAAATIPVRAAKNLKYVVPCKCCPGEKCVFSFRPLIVTDGGIITAKTADGREIFRKTVPFVRPAEMLRITMDVPANAAGIFFELHPKEVLS